VEALAGRIVGDDRLGPALAQEEPQGIAVVGSIGGAQAARRQSLDQASRDGGVAALPGR
jgi:hypothetical protein